MNRHTVKKETRFFTRVFGGFTRFQRFVIGAILVLGLMALMMGC